jgi:Family of unknown function (DUF6328)
MAKLKDKIKTTLDEGRMLILGSQVLLGFQFRSIFEKGFEKLPPHAQYLKMGGLGLMLIAVGLLMSPGAYHQIVEDGEDSHALHRFATGMMGFALLPFALGLGIDFNVGIELLLGRTQGIIGGIAACLLALFFWYGWEAVRRQEREPKIKEKQEMESQKSDEKDEGTKVKDKINQALTEIRVVLPGAQALLGFQFASMLMEGFEKLPNSSKYVHLASLACVAVCIVLLMTPAAYHRLVEKGEETEHMHRVASGLMIAAMVPLALGICGDFFIVARKITESALAAVIMAAAALLFFYGLWFGFTLYRRRERQPAKQLKVEYARQ